MNYDLKVLKYKDLYVEDRKDDASAEGDGH